MGARSKARKRAVDVLFESEVRAVDPQATLAERVAQADPPVPEHTVRLVDGVGAHRERIDELLETYTVDWPLARLPAVDRNVLRVAVYELLWCPDIPDAVAVDEAVRLATALSTERSPAFVNGVLATLASLKPSLQV